jgi:hypothetical protein
MFQNFNVGAEVFYKNSKGRVIKRGAMAGQRYYVVVEFSSPGTPNKTFVNQEIAKLRLKP